MRRALSILMVLVFGLGPLSVMLGASEDSRLPPCCRRHGAHHCAMNAGVASIIAESGETSLTAPATCSSFPGSAAATISAPQALANVPVSSIAQIAQPHFPSAAWAAARMSQIRTRVGRGPPALSLA